jgi:hypothetical protein
MLAWEHRVSDKIPVASQLRVYSFKSSFLVIT